MWRQTWHSWYWPFYGLHCGLHRHLWLTQADLKDSDSKTLLNAPITPSSLFVDSVVERFSEAQKRACSSCHNSAWVFPPVQTQTTPLQRHGSITLDIAKKGPCFETGSSQSARKRSDRACPSERSGDVNQPSTSQPLGTESGVLSPEGFSAAAGTKACVDSYQQYVCGFVDKLPRWRVLQSLFRAGCKPPFVG